MAFASSTTLSAVDLGVSFGARSLFGGLDLTLSDDDVVAVVGPNGSGKSTLMRVVAGDLPADSGVVRRSPPGASLAWLPQVLPDPQETLLEHVLRRTGVAAADRELDAASHGLACGAPGAEVRYAEALDRWSSLGGADLEDRLPAVADAVGLEVDLHRPLGTLSGGQAARASLVGVLLSRYDVLLLDEPTNDLDARGAALVTDFVRGHRGPVLVASHDRRFLDSVATAVVELDLHQGRVAHHAGGWSDYVRARNLARRRAIEACDAHVGAREALTAQARQRQEWSARGHRGVATGGEPDKHQREKRRARADRQAAKGARIARAIDRLEAVEQPRKEWELRYRLDPGAPSSPVVATLDRVVVRRSGFTLGPVDLTLFRGDRVAISGDNGSGKSTLLAVLLGELEPDSGRRSLGSRLRIGVIDQERASLDADGPLLDVVRARLAGPRAELPEAGETRTLLAKFGLGADHVDRPVGSLSTGERTRALMAIHQAGRVNLLVLDEPTNHLDAAAVEQLEVALAGYDGTVVLVSHDRAFVEAVGVTRQWVVAGGVVTVAPDPSPVADGRVRPAPR